MVFKIKNTLLPSSWFEQTIIDTLKLYDLGKDIVNSPLIQFMRNWETTGGMHLDCYKAENYEKAIYNRQYKVFSLYEDIKKRGYVDEKPICVSFDNEGYINLYDGHHRLSILKHLGMEAEVTCTTEWKGAVDGNSGKDFPLFETIEKIHNGKRFMYQWVPDERLKDLPCSRKDMEPRLEYLLKHLKGKTVLDIGCSEGYFSAELAKRGYEVVGVDISKDLVSVARYLSTIQGVKVDYRVGDWQTVVKESKHFDNIIYFSVLHNQINSDGNKKAFEDLELFRGKTGQLFVEIPDLKVQPDWSYIFKEDTFDKSLENRTKLNIQDKWIGYRPILLLNAKQKQFTKPLPSTLNDLIEINGYKMHCPLNDWLINTVRRNGTWEPKTTEFVKKHLKKGQTFVDVGTQAGYYTLLASKMGAKVTSFEPNESNYQLLEKNIKLNKAKNIKLVKKALAPEDGEIKLYIGKTPSEHSIKKTYKNTSGEWEMIEAIKYADHYDVPDWIKIDVEDAEMEVLSGMENILKTDKPIFLLIEDWFAKVPYWLVDNYGFQIVTTERGSGNWILSKNIDIEPYDEPIRVHLLGPFNTPTTLKDEGVANAFGSKVVRMAKILKKLGHYVIFYGVEGSDVVCDEFVQVSTRDVLEKSYGKPEKDKAYGCKYGDLAHNTFNENAIREINSRKLPGDFLLCCFGTYQKQIADAVKIPTTLEIGIGYTGSFAKFRIFESYYMMNYTYANEKRGDINFYNTVIPGYFEEEDFEYSDKKDDYFLYLGRVVKRKGVLIAKQVCEKIGAKLIVAGPSSRDNKWDIAAFEEVIKSPNVEYVGFAGVEKRKKLMSKAKAVFMPTTYLEPFGYVALEANMSGTAVITTDGGAFSETISDHYTGFRCSTFDDFVWAAKHINEIKPENCRKWVTENYSMERATRMYKKYFDQILALHSPYGWYAPARDNSNRETLKLWYP